STSHTGCMRAAIRWNGLIQRRRLSLPANASAIRRSFSATRCGPPISSKEAQMDRQRLAAAALALALLFAAATDYVPQFQDESGKVFGLFALDIYKDALHVASGIWAAAAATWSHRASELFLRIFGILYFVDGIMGTFTGSGFLDLSIVTEGVRNVPGIIKF